MSSFFHRIGVGLIASFILCAAFLALWFALDFTCLALNSTPFGQRLLHSFFESFVGRAIGFYLYGGLYVAFVLSVPLGQIFSFCFFRRRHKQT